MKEVVVTGAARTPMGSFGRTLRDIPAPKLGAVAIAEAVSRSGIRKEDVEWVVMRNGVDEPSPVLVEEVTCPPDFNPT